MASANLDLVRSIFAAQKRGEYSSIEWADPESEYVISEGPDPGSWSVLAAVAEAARERLSPWEHYRVVVEELRELDAERVLVLLHRSGRGKTSGLELGQMPTQGASVHHVRGGKVTRIVFCFDRKRALADLGLAREGASDDPPD